MINFVLEYPGVPSRGFDGLWFSLFIQIGYANSAGSWHHGRKSGQTKTTFIEIGGVVSEESDLGIDNDVEWHWLAFLFSEFLGRQAAQQLFAIFNHRELQRHAHLRRRKPDTRSVPHRLVHISDQSLNFVGNDLLARYLACLGTQAGVPCLTNFRPHNFSISLYLRTLHHRLLD